MRTWPALEIQQADADVHDLIQAFLTDFNVAAIDDNRPDISSVFFHSAGDRDRAAAGLRQQFPHITVRPIDVPDEDWAARSQASLRAVQVGNIIVAPPWDAPAGIRDSGLGIRKPEPIVIVIQPSMGFGTGHHATTRLCLAALQEIDLSGLRVLDVGTGSGVLAIAASRLGAGDVAAIDDDPDAIASARENLELNEGARVTLRAIDLRIPTPDVRIPNPALRHAQGAPSSPRGESRTPDQFDLVIANLTGGLLVAAAERLRSLAASSGRLVLSGLMEEEQDDVLRAFAGLDVERRAQEDEWIAVTLAVRSR
jgi:ribosomal protein L11 methyltransferase